MKKFLLAAVAASVLAGPLMAQSYDGHNDRSRYEQRTDSRSNDNRGHDDRYEKRGHNKGQNQYRSWNRGDRFDSRYARNYRVISSPYQYRLHAAPRGYRWVQSGNDALLVGITTGLIASVLANAIN